MSDAHDQGFEAYLADKSEDANPFDVFTEEADFLDWNNGWNEAEAEAFGDSRDD